MGYHERWLIYVNEAIAILAAFVGIKFHLNKVLKCSYNICIVL
jgi:hypothetical protein